jgi:hypothetical protein
MRQGGDFDFVRLRFAFSQQGHEPGAMAFQIKISLREPSCPSWLKVKVLTGKGSASF